jgi:hypothetical protein
MEGLRKQIVVDDAGAASYEKNIDMFIDGLRKSNSKTLWRV